MEPTLQDPLANVAEPVLNALHGPGISAAITTTPAAQALIDQTVAALYSEPAPGTAPQTPEATGTGVAADLAQGVAETPKALLTGATKAVNETSDAALSIGRWLNSHLADLGYLNLDLDPNTALWENQDAHDARLRALDIDPTDPNAVNALHLPLAGGGEPHSTTGRLVQGFSQFAVGMLGAGRFIKLAGVPGAMAKGAVADATVFDPHEARLANLIEHYPALANPVTAFLQAKADDSEAAGRFKNALEGLGLGIATEALFQGVRALRAARKGHSQELAEATEATEQALRAEGIAPEQALGNHDHQPRLSRPAEAAPAPSSATSPAITPKPEALAELRQTLRADTDDFTRAGTLADEGIDFNFERLAVDADVRNTLNHLAKVFEQEIVVVKGGDATGTRSLAQVKANAERFMDEIGGDPQLYLQRMAGQTRQMQHLDAQVLAQRTLMVSLVKEINAVSAALVHEQPYKGKAGAALEDYLTHMETLGVETVALVKGQQTNIARALNAMKHSAGAREQLLARIDAPASPALPAKERARRHLAAGESLPARVRELQQSARSRAWGVHNEVWINAILSSPKTHAINLLSNALQTGYLPIERVVAGALAGDKALLREGFYQFLGIRHAVTDAARAAYKVLRSPDGQPLLDRAHAIQEPDTLHQHITSKGLGLDADSRSGRLVDGLGQAIRLSSRALATEDEFFKQLAFRSRIYGLAMREARQQGLDATRSATHVQQRLEQAMLPSGAFNPEAALAPAGIAEAHKATFTQALEGGIGQELQGIKARHPWFNIIMPFVRTPTNIARWTWQRTPLLNQLQFQHRADLQAGGTRAAEARARTALGSMFWGAAVSYAAQGEITGHGPNNRFERAALLATGWRPYSYVRTHADGTKTYVSFNRLDPFGMFFGLAADAAETLARGPTQADSGAIAQALIGAVARNLTSKSYLTGLSATLEAITDSERFLDAWLRQQAASYVPALLPALNTDPLLREARTVIEAVKRRIPGLSDTLDPKRNLLGEVIVAPAGWGPDWLSPFASGRDENDPLAHALAGFEHGFMPPSPQHGQIDLTAERWRTTPDQSAYDRYQELIGTVTIGAQTLRQRLTALVTSERYQRLSDNVELPGFHYSGSKLTAVQAVMGRYRERALRTLRREHPALDAALRQDRQHARMARRSRTEAADLIAP